MLPGPGAAGAGMPNQSLLYSYWQNLPPNMLDSTISSFLLGAFGEVFTNKEKTPETVFYHGVYCALASLTHSAATPIFKHFNQSHAATSLDRSWLRGAISLSVPQFIDSFINPTPTFAQRALKVAATATGTLIGCRMYTSDQFFDKWAIYFSA